MTLAALSEITTKAAGTAFGNTCRINTRASEAPSARAASTKSRRASESVWARITRAITGHDVNPSTRIMRSNPAPNSAITTTARKKRGTTRTSSVARMSRSSMVPGR
jgi:hypothetical protein